MFDTKYGIIPLTLSRVGAGSRSVDPLINGGIRERLYGNEYKAHTNERTQ